MLLRNVMALNVVGGPPSATVIGVLSKNVAETLLPLCKITWLATIAGVIVTFSKR